MSENAKWYVIHTYSGYENAVKTAIEKFVANRHLEDMILDIQIPMETVTEVTESGAVKEVERKTFPGYVMVKMVMTDATWHLLRTIRGVTGFVGSATNGRGDRAGEEPRVRGRFHVWPRNARRARARSGRSGRKISKNRQKR